MVDFDRKFRQQHEVRDKFVHDIARGKVKGSYAVATYGRVIVGADEKNVPVKTIDGVTDGTIPVPPEVGEQMSIVSTSANDTNGGTGIHSLIIEYLDHNLVPSYELILLDGLTPVVTIATDIRWIQHIYAASVGTTLLAEGDVIISGVTSGQYYEKIFTGERSIATSFFRVPRGKRLMIESYFAGSSSGTAAARGRIEFSTTKISGLDQTEAGLLYPNFGILTQDSTAVINIDLPVKIDEGVIVGFLASTDKGVRVTAGFGGWIEDAE